MSQMVKGLEAVPRNPDLFLKATGSQWRFGGELFPLLYKKEEPKGVKGILWLAGAGQRSALWGPFPLILTVHGGGLGWEGRPCGGRSDR